MENENSFSYTVYKKDYITNFGNDTLYEGTIIIYNKGYDNVLESSYFPDSLICFCLGVCNKESMPKANFISDSSGYEFIEKYDIDLLSGKEFRKKKTPHSETWMVLIGSISIKPHKNWKKNLNSNHFNNLRFDLGPINDNSYRRRVLVFDN